MMRRGYRLLACVAGAVFSLLTVAAAPAAATNDRWPPTAPSGLRVTEFSFTWARFAWNPSTDNTGVHHYLFEISDTTWKQAVTETSTSRLGGLEPGRGYKATVRAVDRAGNQSPRTTIEFTTLRRTGPAPTTPTNLRAVFVDGKAASIAWDPSRHDGFVYYEVYSGGVSVATTASTSISIDEMLVTMGTIEIGPNFFTVRAWGEHEYGSELSNGLMVTVQ
ncbi:fibronectin type III domain-containing protein [Phytohabitans sp. LJ34]|uniref:fibronectin type III domain-containing protein n=1 Tax=Phytohabitans sp. LJ34 TaxID=3452217 RepID=UPI003F8C6AD4